VTGTPIYDEMRPRYLLVDLPPPSTPRPDTEETTMALTGATLRGVLSALGAISTKRPPVCSFDDLAAGADLALRAAPAGLTVRGAASFLATTAQESDYFRTMTEYGTGQRYAPYTGRGFVQVTWESNYAAFGSWAKARGLIDDANLFVRNPAALADYRWAWLTATWYFDATRLWDWANAGDHLRVSQAVNGGRGRAGTSFEPNHWPARQKAYAAFLAVGTALLPSGPPPAPDPRGGPEMPIDLYFFDDDWKPNPAGLNWRGAVDVEVDGTSGVIDQAWVRWGTKWGASTFRVVAWDATKPLQEPTIDEYRRDYWPVPAAARSVTVEGRRAHSAVIPSARLVEKPKAG